MSERREQILLIAIDIIKDEGYGSLGMRSLARAVGITHGAMRYHFQTWDDLLRALVDYIDRTIKESFDERQKEGRLETIRDFADFMLGSSSEPERYEKLWPQLWAMQEVEPLVHDLLEEIYARYLNIAERLLAAAGSPTPHAEALFLSAAIEGEGLFTGAGRRWEKDRALIRAMILAYIDERYS